jgi:hypothetical protein
MMNDINALSLNFAIKMNNNNIPRMTINKGICLVSSFIKIKLAESKIGFIKLTILKTL